MYLKFLLSSTITGYKYMQTMACLLLSEVVIRSNFEEVSNTVIFVPV